MDDHYHSANSDDLNEFFNEFLRKSAHKIRTSNINKFKLINEYSEYNTIPALKEPFFKDFFKKEKSIFCGDLKIRRGRDRHLSPQDLLLVDEDGIGPHRDDFNEFLEYQILGKIDCDFIILPCGFESERVQGKNQQGQKNQADASGFRLGGCGL